MFVRIASHPDPNLGGALKSSACALFVDAGGSVSADS